jgi:hypothetical protein
MHQLHEKVVPVPWARRLVIDAGRAARRRHAIHYVVDGAPAARFVRRLRELLLAADGKPLHETTRRPA